MIVFSSKLCIILSIFQSNVINDRSRESNINYYFAGELTIYVKQINDALCENCVIVSRKKMLAYIKTAFLVPE